MHDEPTALRVYDQASTQGTVPPRAILTTANVPPAPDSLRAVLRALGPVIGTRAFDQAGAAGAIDRLAMNAEPPTVADCTMLESTEGMPSVRPVALDTAPRIDAFLDGIQRTRVLAHLSGSPVVFATVAAVIRQRVDRRLITWDAPRVRHVVLVSREHVGEPAWEALESANVSPVDLSEASAVPLHPLAVRARALEVVAEERETLERRLAADWCREERGWLWVDGGISGNLAIDANAPAFGVVKSHNTLYGDAAVLRSTLALDVGSRGPLFLVQHRRRRAVASWYLRLHTSPVGDPLHGLVRVEVAPPDSLFAAGAREHSDRPLNAEAVEALAARANDISAWMLAERAPIALPDPRWHTLTYGVYACEQFLKALIGTT